MKALFYQVVRGSETYWETEDKAAAIGMFDDLIMWGFRDREVPQTAQQRREQYVGPAIGVREVRSKMLVRACGGVKKPEFQPQITKPEYDVEGAIRSMGLVQYMEQ